MSGIKKIKNNLILGIAGQVLTILLGIVVPRLVLTSYGSEVNGLINSITQIYTYVGLLEAGIGIATVQALYRTIASNSNDETNAVLAATNRYYHRVGSIYLFVVLVFSCVYPFVIKSDIPIHTIVLIILFNGLGSVISFFFQGKYFLLLQAEGKNYIQTAVVLFTNVLKSAAKIVFINLGFSVVFVQAMAFVVSLIQMIYISIYIKRNYKWINLKVKPDFDSISQSKNVLVHRVGGLVFNNTDMIILSFFCGLKVVSVYSMYTLFFSMINTALETVSNSFIFKIGQTFHVSKEKFNKMYNVFELYFMTLVFALFSVANFFINPFIKLYTSGINDIQYVDKYLPLLFIFTYLLSCGRTASNHAISFAGHFKQTQWRSLLEAAINITVSLIAVNFLGIYGVLIGTIAALLYRTNDMIIYAGKKILNCSVFTTYKRWLINLATFLFVLFLNRFLNFELSSYVDIFIWCIPYTIATLLLFFTVSTVFEFSTAKYLINAIKQKIKR